MTEAERVLAEVATKIHSHSISYNTIRELTAPYLPKPEPDRLTAAARECLAVFYSTGELTVNIMDGKYDKEAEIPAIRAIIGREVAAAEPSDETIERVFKLVLPGGLLSADTIRAALRGEGA